MVVTEPTSPRVDVNQLPTIMVGLYASVPKRLALGTSCARQLKRVNDHLSETTAQVTRLDLFERLSP